MLLTPFEKTLVKRYLLPGRSEAFIALVAGISLVAVALGVAALVIVMSVMNGFRAELFDKISGLNGHAVVQAYGGRLDNWQGTLKLIQSTPGVTRASPLIEQPQMIDPAWLEGVDSIGITAGASAPERLIEDLVQAVRDRFDADVVEDDGARETVTFKLPRVLTT